MRQDHRGGEKLFVDYGEGLNLVAPKSGEPISTQLFVAVWGASNYTYAEATLTQQLPDWIGSHVRAFSYFGCVPKIVVPDCLKGAVSRACLYEPELNPTYAEMAEHYGICVLPARPAHPKDKAKVEAGVLIAKRWILSALRHRTFYSLTEINSAIGEHLEWTPSRIVTWAQKIGPATAQLVEKIIASRTHPEQAYRSCLGILRLEKHYPKERLEKASKRALKFGAHSFRSLKNILSSGLDRVEENDSSAELALGPHENIRGSHYYH